ncbi:MAG: hypothetical protein AAFN93_19280 [Bacteroidota bacterium]
MKSIAILSLALIVSFSAYAQKPSRMEKLITSKNKWTARDVKSRRPYFEVGEQLKFRVDGTFYHERNNYAKLGGDWTMGEKLLLVYDSFTEERRRIPFEYKVKPWDGDGFMLKYRNRNNKKEKVYFK